jgi:phage baseplate assembly protein W
MSKTRISRSFKDISLSFVPHPVTKDLSVLQNENAIKRSVRNLVETIPTERFFNSLLGSDIRRSLFEFVDFGTAASIKDQIEITINNFESRVTNVQIQVNPLTDQNAFNVTIIYDIIGQEFPTQEFTFILEATR